MCQSGTLAPGGTGICSTRTHTCWWWYCGKLPTGIASGDSAYPPGWNSRRFSLRKMIIFSLNTVDIESSRNTTYDT